MRSSPILAVLCVATLAAGCGMRSAAPPAPLYPPALEVRLADTSPRPGWIVLERADEPAVLHLSPENVIGTSDLEAAAATPTPEGLRLDLWLRQEATERLARVTGENVGRWMAVLVDGQVRSAASIAQAVGGAGVPLQLRLRMAPHEAERLRARIDAAWPPGPPGP